MKAPPLTVLDCIVVGDAPLLVDCTRQLLTQGHRVQAVISDDPEIRSWASNQKLRLETFDAGLAERLAANPIDYLFSIANLRLLPESLLAVPRQLAINFHDGPLPRHAGLFATSWAILEGARVHGVTWHVMTGTPDGGDILQQRSVLIESTDTSWSLNLKCHEAGLASFVTLVDQLVQERTVRVPQDLRKRTYHGRYDGPPRGGVLSWNQPAEALDALVRACCFGRQANEFGDALLAVDDDFVVVAASEVGCRRSGAPPGTILAIDEAMLAVATVSRDIHLTSLATLDGEPVRTADLASQLGLVPGVRLPEIPAADWASRVPLLARHERFWVRRLGAFHDLDVDWRNFSGDGVASCLAVATLPAALVPLPQPRRDTLVLAAFLAFLTRIGGSQYRIGLRANEWGIGAPCQDPRLAGEWPFRALIVDPGATLTQLGDAVACELAELRSHVGFRRTIRLRHPRLRAQTPNERNMPSVTVELVERLGADTPEPTGVLLQLSSSDARYRFATGRELPVAATFQERFAAFLDAATVRPDADIGLLPLLAPAERRQIVTAWNDTEVDYPHDRCVQHFVAGSIQRHPNRPAIRCGDDVLTYGELGRRIDRRTAELARLGVLAGARVGVYLRRSFDLPVTLLAILRAGAAYVPLDPVYPPARLSDVILDADVAAVVTERALRADLPPDGTATLVIDGGDERPLSELWLEGAPLDRASPDGLAYVIYTSGSTGQPKGVKVLHRGLTNLLCAMAQRLTFTAWDSLLAVTTVTFDIAALEIFLPLMAGGELEIVPREVATDGLALSAHLARRRPSFLQATPATWRMLLTAGWAGDAGLTVLCGGEAVPDDLADTLPRLVKAAWNMYGPTETTIWSSMSKMVPGKPVTIGAPIANTQFYILDERGQLLPPGIPGELHIGGDGVAAGYDRRPELTANKFVSNPFGAGCLYRTGDRVAWQADGEVRFLGRADTQVKLHGYRIELGEVEAALRRHPGVADTAVQLHHEPSGVPELVAYVVASASPTPATDLRSFLRAELPDYSLPSRILRLAALPRLPSGKLDRARLRPGPISAGDVRHAVPSASNPLEATIAAIWRQVLRFDAVRIDENFFDAGGNSLRLSELVARLTNETKIEVTRTDMFRFPTIQAMARHLAAEAPKDVHGFRGSGGLERRRLLELRLRRSQP